MTNETKLSVAVQIAMSNDKLTFASLEDFSYTFASVADTTGAVMGKLAAWCRDNIKGFPEDIGKDDAAHIRSGFVRRKGELMRDKGEVRSYVHEGAKYLPLASADSGRSTQGDVITMDVGFIMAQRDMKALKKSDPALYDLLAPARKTVQDYVASRWRDFMALAKFGADGSRHRKERGEDKSFATALDEAETAALKRYDSRAKVADPTIGAAKREDVSRGFRAMRMVLAGTPFAYFAGVLCKVTDEGQIVKPETVTPTPTPPAPKAAPTAAQRKRATGK